jgi:hypothetical protein
VDEQVIVGEAVAGQATNLKRRIAGLIRSMNVNTFDLVDGLHEMESKRYYLTLGFNSFAEYGKSLDLKLTKVYYLARIGKIMSEAGIPRAEYEPVGTAKLRAIIPLNVLDKAGNMLTYTEDGETWTMAEVVQTIMADAKNTDIEQIEERVKRIQGKTGDDTEEWVNFKVSRLVKNSVIKPAIEKAKLHIGTVGEDKDGMAIEPSDSAALEGIASYYLSDATIGSKS